MKYDIFQTSAIVIPDPEVEEFAWTFLVPPRSKVHKCIESVTFGGFCFNGLRFKTGFLAETDHKWGFSLYPNQVNTYISLPKRDALYRYVVHDSKLELVSESVVKATHSLKFQQDETGAAPRMLWTGCWVNSDKSWDDGIDAIRVKFRVSRESIGRCILAICPQHVESRSRGVISSATQVDCKDFFMSDYLSDVVIECRGQKYPAHRFLLSCRSSVFNRMFQVGMKEVEEGRVVIEDMEQEVLEELLRFMYCGSVTSTLIGEICVELFQAAHKYDIEPLKVICEGVMIGKVNPENALEMYITAEVHDAQHLKERASDEIRTNKKKVFHDRETFRLFCSRYPDLTFDLFNLG